LIVGAARPQREMGNMKYAEAYTVRKLFDNGVNHSVWSVVGNGINRKVEIGARQPGCVALMAAMREEKEDSEYLLALQKRRLAGG
jgi:hypothetical protein